MIGVSIVGVSSYGVFEQGYVWQQKFGKRTSKALVGSRKDRRPSGKAGKEE